MCSVEPERGGQKGDLLKSVGLEELVGLGTGEASEEIFGHRVIFYAAILFLVLLVPVHVLS